MDSIWWSKVPNAKGLIDTIKQQLLDEQSVLLQYNEALPWKTTFIDDIRSAVREGNSSKSFCVISGVSAPGEYLLAEYCKAEKRASYRPSKGYAKFFAESDDIILHEYYFWIIIRTSEELKEWSAFVSDYIRSRENGKSRAVFVLDCYGITNYSKYKGIEKIECEKLINQFDKRVFATMITSEIREESFLKTYLAELVVNVAGHDVELMAFLISDYKTLLRDLGKVLERAADIVHDDGTSIVIKNDSRFIDQSVWRTQIRTIYPYIEEFRRTFVESHYGEISKCLPIDTKAGETIYEPYEVELGTLVYFAGIKSLVLKTTEYERLNLFKEARNSLSHLKTLSWTDIEKML